LQPQPEPWLYSVIFTESAEGKSSIGGLNPQNRYSNVPAPDRNSLIRTMNTVPRRFSSVARLYGEVGFARIAAAHVVVVGVGGVGSWAVEALARSGVGQLTLIDLDHVAESNINRQIQALDSTLGAAKVRALQDRIGAVNPACRVATIEEFITPASVAGLIPAAADWVVDAIDDVPAKVALIAHCRNRDRALITTGGAGAKLDPTRVLIRDLAKTEQDALLAKTRRQLRREHGFPSDIRRPFGIPCVYSDEPLTRGQVFALDHSAGLNCAGYGASVSVTATFGFVAASHVLRELAANETSSVKISR
jgi:tRNA A37 threonylcarbamoyladenosine dehydratase